MGRKFSNKMAVLIAEEGAGNYGVPPTPYNNTNYQGVIVSAPNISPSGEKIARDFIRTTFTKTAPNIGRKLNEISFGTELKGNNDSDDPGASFYLHSLLKGCGLIPAVLTWVDSNGANPATMDIPFIFELDNDQNITDFTLYENIWVVQDPAESAAPFRAKVIGLGRRKDADGDTVRNDLIAVLLENGSNLLGWPAAADFVRDNANSPGLSVASSSYSGWKAAAFVPTSDYVKMIDGSLTMHYQVDDIRHETPGVLGSFSLTLEDGSTPKLDFNFTGLWKDPVDIAPIANITFPDWSPASVCRSNLIIADDGGVGVGLENTFKPSFTRFNFDLGAAVTLVPNLNASECSGEVGITDRDPKGGVDPLVDDLSVFNPWSTWSKGDSKFMSFCVGYNVQGMANGDRGKVIMFNAPEVLFVGNGYQDRSGMAAYGIELGFSGNEDDEFVIVFG